MKLQMYDIILVRPWIHTCWVQRSERDPGQAYTRLTPPSYNWPSWSFEMTQNACFSVLLPVKRLLEPLSSVWNHNKLNVCKHNTQVPPRANRVQGTATTWGGSQNSDCTACGWSGLGGNSWSLWSGNRHSRKKGRDFVDTIPLPHPQVLSLYKIYFLYSNESRLVSVPIPAERILADDSCWPHKQNHLPR